MTNNTTQPEPLPPESKATITPTTVRLDKFKFGEYRHRPDEEIDPENKEVLQLADSIFTEGLSTLIEFVRDEHGNEVVNQGHRRIIALRILAERKMPGYSLEMMIPANEILKATPQDLIIHSVFDNANRAPFGPKTRICISKKMHDAGVSVKRAASALNVDPVTYERDLVIVRNPWCYDRVIKGSIGATHASTLLKAADKVGRLDDLREYLDGWIADGKEMPPDLVKHWTKLLEKNQPLDDAVQESFTVAIDTEKGQITFGHIKLDLSKFSAKEIAKLASKTSCLTKRLALFHEKVREKEEKGEGVTEATESQYDMELLRTLRPDVAKEVEEQMRVASEPDGEEAPQEEPAEREEQDLTDEIQLPLPAAAETTPPAQAKSTPTATVPAKKPANGKGAKK